MCFSPGVSFAASGVLAGFGTASIASNNSVPRRLFAATPMLFAAQQAAEGFVWRTIGDVSTALPLQVAVNTFLVVALIVWPVWLPLSLERIEEDAARRRVLHFVRLFGTLVAVGSAAMLIRMRPEVTIVGHSLHYDFAGTDNAILSASMLIAYLIPTLLPMFVSTTPYAHRIGALVVLSVIAASYVQKEALTSVWCFFASLVSASFLFAVRHSPAPVLDHRAKLHECSS